ncbi:hypothetical protein [uncultured Abiotrophia sp.]|uniref:hypothetical protein n=1 Tax=uncultured Abiotrophia sp. TaxID=316094 RepID=UPI0028D3D7F2|nr:hypothetical protein [uncultured Abiotrophia sp.]
MIKRIRMLYSDSKDGIREEIAEFKQEPYVSYPRVEIIEHQNGHCTALVRYRYKSEGQRQRTPPTKLK